MDKKKTTVTDDFVLSEELSDIVGQQTGADKNQIEWFKSTFPDHDMRISLYRFIRDNMSPDVPVKTGLSRFQELYNATGNRFVKFNPFAHRAYSGFPKTILVNKATKNYGQDIMDELAHKLAYKLAKTVKNVAFSYSTGNFSDWEAFPGYGKNMYAFPGSDEYDAHIIVEQFAMSYITGKTAAESLKSDSRNRSNAGKWFSDNKDLFDVHINSIDEFVKCANRASRNASRYGIDLYLNYLREHPYYCRKKDIRYSNLRKKGLAKRLDAFARGTIRNIFPFSILDKAFKIKGLRRAQKRLLKHLDK